MAATENDQKLESFGSVWKALIVVKNYRVVQKKGSVLLSTSLVWPAVAGCSRADTFSQVSSISFAQPCTLTLFLTQIAAFSVDGV